MHGVCIFVFDETETSEVQLLQDNFYFFFFAKCGYFSLKAKNFTKFSVISKKCLQNYFLQTPPPDAACKISKHMVLTLNQLDPFQTKWEQMRRNV